MQDIYKNKKVIIVCISLLLLTFILFLINKKNNIIIESNTEDYKYLKNYKSNEFIPVYITEEDMAKKYLNDYKNNMLYNVEEAYNSLNREYRSKKFGNLDSYKEYVDELISLATNSLEVDKYSITKIGGRKVYSIFDKNGYQYIFKEISIMNYEVYLDEVTVEIK